MTKEDLDSLIHCAVDNIELLLDRLGIDDYTVIDDQVRLPCPVHGGDNQTGCVIYLNNDTVPGGWACNTRGCQEHFGIHFMGFLRGVISHDNHEWTSPGDDEEENCDKALTYLKGMLSDKSCANSVRYDKAKKELSGLKHYAQRSESKFSIVSREKALSLLDIPAQYYVDRGYEPDTLRFFDVGTCEQAKAMRERVIVPIYNETKDHLVGYTGRSLHEQCEQCGAYHPPGGCYIFPKWKHSKGFKSSQFLYNYCNAKTEIAKAASVIVVESPGNVWRLHEAGIQNAVAIFGTKLSVQHQRLIGRAGALSVVLAFDNDKAGGQAARDAKRKLNAFDVHTITLPPGSNDVGGMELDEITRLFGEFADGTALLA